MRFRLLFFLACPVAIALAAQAPADNRSSVAGQVMRADTGEPLRRAVVTMRPAEGRSSAPLAASTGPDGRFEMGGIPPGQYRIWVSRNGFLAQEYGQKSYGRPGMPVTLAARQEMTGIAFRMVPQGAISGRVVNEDGEKISYVRIQAFRQGRVQGRRQWTPAGMSATNDLGEYRIFGLYPGRYFLAAQYTSALAPVAAPGDAKPGPDAEEAYAPLYYPGSLDPVRATPVEAPPGADVRGIDFTLVPTRTVRIRGRVKFEASDSLTRPVVALFPRTSAFLGFMGRHGAQVDEKGEFEIRGVTPGSYWLTADMFGENKRLTFRSPLEVGTSSIEGANLVLGPAPVLNGRVRAEADAKVSLGGIRIYLQTQETGSTGSSGFATVKPDGAFAVQNLANDVYVLTLARSSDDDVYIKSIRLGDSDVTESALDLTQGVPGPLDITLAPGTAQLSGTVMREQQPAAGATVVIVPEGARRSLSRFYRTGTADQNGAFVMRGVTPGDYKVFAWDELEESIYQDPEFLQPFESKGRAVSLKPQARETVQLELLSGTEASR
jgi:hypothetical protein